MTPSIVPASIARENQDYLPLLNVLLEAHAQAASGKGAERHANGRPFVDQPIFQINRAIGSAHGAIYQVAKKAEESAKMQPEKACAELMGSIVYAAASIILIREFASKENTNDPRTQP